MQLLRSSEVGMGSNDTIFSHSRVHALLAAGAALGGASWALVRAVTLHWKPGYFIGGTILLLLDLLRRFVGARFRSSNWLVRMNQAGLFIQFRSYLNFHLPPEDLTVVFVAFPEIRSARLVRERIQLQGQRGTEYQIIHYAELELAGDLLPLQNALQAERGERAPTEKRWYGSTSTLYEDYPVRLEQPPFLQLHWDVTPGIRTFLKALQPYTTIAEAVSVREDLAHLKGLEPQEQQRRLRELVQRGRSIDATYAVCRLYGCGLSEAHHIVESIAGEKTAEQPETKT